MMTTLHKSESTPADTNSPLAPRSRVATVMHSIRLKDMIVHKYTEGDALIRKAHKIASDMINEDLRQGEYVRSLRLGEFQLFCPNLTPEAGELRCSVLTNQIYRAIKDINPTYHEISAKLEEPLPARAPSRPLSRRSPRPDLNTESMKRLASDALKMMSTGNHLRLEELLAMGGENLAPQQFDAHYHPVWMQAKQHVTAYRLTLAHKDKQYVPAGELATGIGDILGVLHAKDALKTLEADGTPALILAPIHFSTLESARIRPILIQILSSCPELFHKYLVCDLIMPPGEVSRFRLRESKRYLQGRCRAYGARIEMDCRNLSPFAEAGFRAVGIDWRKLRGSDAVRLGLLDDLSARAATCGLQSYIRSVTSHPGLVAAVASGFHFIDGPVVHGPLRMPMGIRPFGFGQIYRHMRPSQPNPDQPPQAAPTAA